MTMEPKDVNLAGAGESVGREVRDLKRGGRRKDKSLWAKALDVMASYAVAIVILFLLLVVTFFGTLEQVEHGLYDTQRKYFDSIWLVHELHIGRVLLPIPLPGAYLLMGLLFVNMSLGLARRMFKQPRTLGALVSRSGLIIAHGSILFMLAAGFVSYHYKTEGNMALFEGQVSDHYQSYHNRVVELRQIHPPPADGEEPFAWVIDQEWFEDLQWDESRGRRPTRTFFHPDLPFELQLGDYVRNSMPARADQGSSRALAGFEIRRRPLEPESERNLDALRVHAMPHDGGQSAEHWVWGGSIHPLTLAMADGSVYTLELTRRRWQLPFSVRLDEFIHERHPGTNIAREFISRVTQIDATGEHARIIQMNEPLRDSGYVLYQASFGSEQLASGTERPYSVFAVVRNPSDQWPLWACIAVAIGLLMHFCVRLWLHLTKSLQGGTRRGGRASASGRSTGDPGPDKPGDTAPEPAPLGAPEPATVSAGADH